MNTLKELYIDQLQDLWSATRQKLAVLPELRDAASEPDLRKALDSATTQTRDQVEHLEALCERHDARPAEEFCKGMEGLVTEARKHALDAPLSDEVRDASIITQFQRMSHYGIAGLGTAKAFAGRLDLKEDEHVLELDLETIYKADEWFTRIAVGEVNPEAKAA